MITNNYLRITLSSDLMYNKKLKIRNLCILGENFQTLISCYPLMALLKVAVIDFVKQQSLKTCFPIEIYYLQFVLCVIEL